MNTESQTLGLYCHIQNDWTPVGQPRVELLPAYLSSASQNPLTSLQAADLAISPR